MPRCPDSMRPMEPRRRPPWLGARSGRAGRGAGALWLLLRRQPRHLVPTGKVAQPVPMRRRGSERRPRLTLRHTDCGRIEVKTRLLKPLNQFRHSLSNMFVKRDRDNTAHIGGKLNIPFGQYRASLPR